MVIVSSFDGNQKKFHSYRLPLMYKHQECEFHISGKFVHPSDLKNLHVNRIEHGKGPILKCPMNMVPTYRAMIELQRKNPKWIGTPEELGEVFYEV